VLIDRLRRLWFKPHKAWSSKLKLHEALLEAQLVEILVELLEALLVEVLVELLGKLLEALLGAEQALLEELCLACPRSARAWRTQSMVSLEAMMMERRCSV
jgi:hypothetical protein